MLMTDLRAAILRELGRRPMKLQALQQAVGATRADIKSAVSWLESAGQISQRDDRAWHIGVGLIATKPALDFAVREEVIAPGHRRIQFGDRYQGGRGGGQRRRDPPSGGGHPLAGIYE
jgi:hypothetical protein